MSKEKRGRKHRTPQKRTPREASVPRPRGAVPPVGGLPLRGSMDHTARMLEHAKPDQLVELVLPYLWVGLAEGRVPANVCVDACLTLRHAYGQLGVKAELLPVGLAVQDRNGGGTRYGSLTPSWTGTSWNGHCVLVLPESERFVDAPVEQFLGAIGSPEQPGVSYVEIRPVAASYEAYLHKRADAGSESFVDLVALPPFTSDAEEEDFGQLLGVADAPQDALLLAEQRTGALRERWVNQGLAQDEYRDFVRAGRPAITETEERSRARDEQ